MKDRFIKLVSMIRETGSSGSIDAEHYIAVGYCFGIIIPVIISGLGIKVVFFIPITFLKFLTMVFFIIMNFFFLSYYIKKMLSYFKNRRIMLGCISLPIIYLFLLFALSWSSLFFGNLSNMLNIAWMGGQEEFIAHPEESLLSTLDNFRFISQFMAIVGQMIGFSLFLNMILPNSLQAVKVSSKKKFTRLLIKVSFLAIMILLIAIFLNTGKEDFFSITAIYGVIIAFASPKMILQVFSNIKDIDNKSISPEINKAFNIFKFFWAEFYIAWVISIRIYGSESSLRMRLFAIISVILVFLTVSIKFFFQFKNKTFFSSWIIDEDNDDKLE